MARYNCIGERYGKLVVLGDAEDHVSQNGRRIRRVHVRCDCGVEVIVRLNNLRTGASKTCGCSFVATGDSARRFKHGEAIHGSTSAEYSCWQAMIKRCENPKVENYANYGGRGIRVCDRWRGSFECFLADMGRKPSTNHTIERDDNDGNYEPSNCRWATKSEQRRNQRPRKSR